MKTHPSIPPVPLPDFERVSQAILGILAAEKAEITGSCLFFGIMGQAILQKHYRLNAKAVVGNAGFNLTGSDAIVFSDLPVSYAATIEKSNFHCWVEADGWALDFSSIVFPEINAIAGFPPCQRLMFQKPLSKSAPSIFELNGKGSFHLLSDSPLTTQEIPRFLARQAYADLVEICVNWYQKPPKKMPKIGLVNKHGVAKPTVISPFKFNGAW